MRFTNSMEEGRGMATRQDAMYLGTLRPSDLLEGQRKGHLRQKEEDTSLSLLTKDIPGATPRYYWKELTNRSQKVEVLGSTSRSHYPSRNRALDFSLTVGDIEKAHPGNQSFATTRFSDPLVPQYNLQSCRECPPTPEGPRNRRDLMQTSDLETGIPQRKPLWTDRGCRQDKMDTSDIEYAKPNHYRKVELPSLGPIESLRNPLRYSEGINTSRSVRQEHNPLDPQYVVSERSMHPFFGSKDASATVHGPVKGSTPRRVCYDNGEPQISLITRDIPGASPMRFVGSKSYNIYDPPEVTPIYSFHDPKDIDGAQAGSRLRRRHHQHGGSSTNAEVQPK